MSGFVKDKERRGRRRKEKMSCSVAKVEKAYQEVRAISRKRGCNTLEEARIALGLDCCEDWKLSAKEERALKLKCGWLGI